MAGFDDAARLGRMTEWIKVIASEVADTLLEHYIFWEVQAVIRANSALAKARSHFFQWMGDVFVSSAASAVRRQIDSGKDSICLRRLLMEVRDYAQIVTRAHYLGVCGNPPVGDFLRDINEHAFDKWAGSGGTYVDPNGVEHDLQTLLDTCERIRHYVNKRVAHFDKHGIAPGMMPTFQDLDDACSLLERLTQKYHLMFTGVWIGQLRPAIIYDWTGIFDVAWRTPGSSEVQ
jgi:hypothetical protein